MSLSTLSARGNEIQAVSEITPYYPQDLLDVIFRSVGVASPYYFLS